MSVSRVVVLFTPLFVALSGYVVTQAARLPGAPKLDAGEMTWLFTAGATLAGGAVVTWLHNRGKHERQEAALVAGREEAEVYASRATEPEPVEDVEYAKKALGLIGLEADVSRALAGMRAFDRRLELIETADYAARRSRAEQHTL